MSEPSELEEIEGRGLADYALTSTLLHVLVSSGVLSKDEAVKVLLASLDSLEAQQMNAPEDKSYRVARKAVQGLIETFDDVPPSIPQD